MNSSVTFFPIFGNYLDGSFSVADCQIFRHITVGVWDALHTAFIYRVLVQRHHHNVTSWGWLPTVDGCRSCSVGYRVPLRSLFHWAVVWGDGELKLGVEDSVVGGHEGVDGVGADGPGALLLLLQLLNGSGGWTQHAWVVTGHVDLVSWIFGPKLERQKI